MEEGLRKSLLHARIVEVDKNVVSPSERALFINGVLKAHAPELTAWDVIAGLTDILSSYIVVEPSLEDVIKPLVKRVYTIHYVHGSDLKSCLTKSNLPETLESDSIPFEPLKLMESVDLVL